MTMTSASKTILNVEIVNELERVSELTCGEEEIEKNRILMKSQVNEKNRKK